MGSRQKFSSEQIAQATTIAITGETVEQATCVTTSAGEAVKQAAGVIATQHLQGFANGFRIGQRVLGDRFQIRRYCRSGLGAAHVDWNAKASGVVRTLAFQ